MGTCTGEAKREVWLRVGEERERASPVREEGWMNSLASIRSRLDQKGIKDISLSS